MARPAHGRGWRRSQVPSLTNHEKVMILTDAELAAGERLCQFAHQEIGSINRAAALTEFRVRVCVAIVGGGPGGAASAMFLADHGISSVIIEKEQFPRYHIGESMSGECGAILRSLGLEQEMLRRGYPIKRGLSVYGPNGNNAWFVPVMGRDHDWKLFPQSTWQVRREHFDKMLLDIAIARGATLVRGQAAQPILDDDGGVRGVTVRTADGGTLDVESDVVLDCSGQATFLANAGVTGPKYRGNYDKQIAIFSQVAGAIRDEDPHRDDTLIFYQKKYHWSWFIPLDREVVSVGVVIPGAYFKDKKESKAEFLMRELRELNPEMKRRIPDVALIEEPRSIANYSYQVRRFCGKGFICIGDAHRFIDPIFSFGLYVAVNEAKHAAVAIKDYLNGKGREDANPFAEHQLYFEKGIDILEDMMDTFWEYPLAFAYMTHIKYVEEILDIFAGRLWERQPSTAVREMRKLLKRERRYDADDQYSMPIGSRYHSERASIWEAEPG
jgi:1H-pyrrole-2-carbonyl-[peptidyl-carrier protein] brominase